MWIVVYILYCILLDLPIFADHLTGKRPDSSQIITVDEANSDALFTIESDSKYS